MKRLFLLTFIALSSLSLSAQALNQTFLDYIAKYRELAIWQQYKHGVPAAITMAQGLLESAAGTSYLAVNGNNHFGIKCTPDWEGRTILRDDDIANECFRRYACVDDSYEDHSLFLKRKRYEGLFLLGVNDYKNWAYGLKACGYATDPNYPEKLIRIIEQYNLNELTNDTMLVYTGKIYQPYDFKQGENIAFAEQSQDENYVTPAMEELELYHNHKSGRRNGVRFIIAGANESYASLALYLNMYERTLRRYNDALDNRELQEGDIVYIYPKKKKASRRHPYHFFKTGETAWEIAQRYGIRLKSFYEINGIPYGTPLTTNQRLRLR